ncbi:MAG: hypothetical protein ACE5IJ_09700, partial [Thermoplasmata archaeon]
GSFFVAKQAEICYTIPSSQIEMESDVMGKCSVPQGIGIRRRFCARAIKTHDWKHRQIVRKPEQE